MCEERVVREMGQRDALRWVVLSAPHRRPTLKLWVSRTRVIFISQLKRTMTADERCDRLRCHGW